MPSMPLEDVMALWSNDYEVSVREIRAEMTTGEDCWHSEDGFDECHEFIHHLTSRMREYGWAGPPVCIVGGTLTNGHHRVLAAQEAGIKNIPYTDNWKESGGQSW